MEIITKGENLQDQSTRRESFTSSSSRPTKDNASWSWPGASTDWDATKSISEHNSTSTVSPLEQADLSTLENPFGGDMFEPDLSLWNDDYDPVLGLEFPASLQTVDQNSYYQEPTASLAPVSSPSGLAESQASSSEPGICAISQPPVFSLPEPPAIVDQL
jgi:hypothetical protein